MKRCIIIATIMTLSFSILAFAQDNGLKPGICAVTDVGYRPLFLSESPVDLGLSVKWDSINICAAKPSDAVRVFLKGDWRMPTVNVLSFPIRAVTGK